MKINPLYDFVLVKREASKDRTESGLIIPDNAKEKPTFGVVMAVGPGKVLDNGARREPSVKKGDRILFGKYSGNELRNEVRAWSVEDDLILMREDDIYGVVEE